MSLSTYDTFNSINNHPKSIQLTGHKQEINCGKFSDDNNLFATGGMDNTINIWNINKNNQNQLSSSNKSILNKGRIDNILTIKTHSNGITSLKFMSSSERIVSSSADKKINIHNLEKNLLIKKLKHHNDIVHCIDIKKSNPNLLVSVSDDCKYISYDLRIFKPISIIAFPYSLTSVSLSNSNDNVFIGGIDNKVYCLDNRSERVLFEKAFLSNTITSLSVSPCDRYLLSNSMDDKLTIWNLKYIHEENKELYINKVLSGHRHDFQMNLLQSGWSIDSRHVFSGSSDRNVYIWNVVTGDIKYKLSGHTGCVNDVDYNHVYGILSSVSSDRTAILDEIIL